LSKKMDILMCNSIVPIQAADPYYYGPAAVDLLCRLQAGYWILSIAWFGLWLYHMVVLLLRSFHEQLVHCEEA
jgi:hypothetical protein